MRSQTGKLTRGLEIGGDVRDLIILSLAQGFYVAMENKLYTGVWRSPQRPSGW